MNTALCQVKDPWRRQYCSMAAEPEAVGMLSGGRSASAAGGSRRSGLKLFDVFTRVEGFIPVAASLDERIVLKRVWSVGTGGVSRSCHQKHG